MPERSFADSVLHLCGKQRAVFVPTDGVNGDIRTYRRALKESFWKALLRPRGTELPRGWLYPSVLEDAEDGV